MRLLAALILAASALGSLPPGKVQAAALTVDTLADTADGSCTDGSCSLRDAIQTAAPGDEIRFSVTGTISLLSTLQIQKNLSIIGPGANQLVLKGNGRQVLSLYGASLALSEVTITNGRASTGGGIYLGSQATLALEDAVISANTATTGGGGIYVDAGAALTVKDSVVQNNRASQRGGGIYVVSGSTLAWTGGTLKGNAVTGFNGQGGGVYIDGGTIRFEDLEIVQNTAGQALAQGGGAFINRGEVILVDNLVRGNTAGQGGGGLYVSAGATRLTNLTISANQAPAGSAVYNSAENSIAVTNSIVWGNPSDVLHQQFYDPTAASLTFTASLVEGGIAGKPVLVDNPAFVRDANPGADQAWGTADDDPGDLRLRPQSPAIDSGTNAACPAHDLEDTARPKDGNGDGSAVCDLGAYEFVDRAPTAVDLTNTIVDEGQPVGAAVGKLSATDPDTGDTFTYSLVPGTGSEDNASFTISGEYLKTATTFNIAQKSLYSIRIRATDWAHSGFEQAFTIQIVRPTQAILPATGFAPGRTTALLTQPLRAYDTLGELWLEIPGLVVKETIVGVPKSGKGWDVTWLSDQIGYLEGTAFPTWTGNSVLSAHSILSSGLPGPFSGLEKLHWGDRIVVHAWGDQYIYEVREVTQVKPNDLSPLRHQEHAWLTLLTCTDYDADDGVYRSRSAVSAVLVQVVPEP